MGKFCVKAAIVSSLAIAEEDYDTTIGAPIELKRNLIARGTARPLKKGQIISEGGSLRALSEGEGSCIKRIPFYNFFCGEGEGENEKIESKLNSVTEQLDGVIDVVKTETSILEKIQSATNLLGEGVNATKNMFIEKEQELKSEMVDLRNSINNLSDDPEGLKKLKTKIDGTLAIAQVISGLVLSEDMHGQAKKMFDSLKEVQKTLEKKKEDAQESFREKIDEQFNLAKEALTNLSGEAKEWIKKIDEKISHSSQVVDLVGGLIDSFNQ